MIRDHAAPSAVKAPAPDWAEEALGVLLQLQYKRPEAQEMIAKAFKRNPKIASGEEILNEVYRGSK